MSIFRKLFRTGPKVNVGDRVQAAVDHVKDRRPFVALLAFCGLDSPFDKVSILAAAERNLSHSASRDIFDLGVLASNGRQVNRGDLSAIRAERIAAEARSIFRLYAGMTALFEIQPALGQLRFEHAYSLDDFIALAQRSPVVPADGAVILGQGLYVGYCRDMVQAMYILMQQFEHMVRHVISGADGGAHPQESASSFWLILCRWSKFPLLGERVRVRTRDI